MGSHPHLDLLSPVIEIDDVDAPSSLFYVSYYIDCSVFPVLLMTVTYVLSYFHFRLERPAACLLLLSVAMSLVRFGQQILFRSQTQYTYMMFGDFIYTAFYQMLHHLVWLLIFYFMCEIHII